MNIIKIKLSKTLAVIKMSRNLFQYLKKRVIQEMMLKKQKKNFMIQKIWILYH